MTQTYYISGMTCNGCKSSVEAYLASISGVESVVVDLEKGQAVLSSNLPINLDVIQKKLPQKYQVSLNEKAQLPLEGSVLEPSKLKQLQPLLLIFGYLLAASILLNYRPWDVTAFMLDFMGLFYIVFSFFKLLDLKGFPPSFAMYDPIAKKVPFYGWIYPFIEIALGLMFLMRFELTTALISTIVVLGVTTVGVTRSLVGKKKIQCACLGTALKLPMTEATFIENTVMILMALLMLLKL